MHLEQLFVCKKSRYKEQLEEAIPLVRQMDISVADVSTEKTSIDAPLASHFNYEGTAFGGSLSTVAIISCYLHLHNYLKENNYQVQTQVIQDANTKYLIPVTSDFRSCASFFSVVDLEKFKKMLSKKKIGRVKLCAAITTKSSSEKLVLFTGSFVVKTF